MMIDSRAWRRIYFSRESSKVSLEAFSLTSGGWIWGAFKLVHKLVCVLAKLFLLIICVPLSAHCSFAFYCCALASSSQCHDELTTERDKQTVRLIGEDANNKAGEVVVVAAEVSSALQMLPARLHGPLGASISGNA